MTDRRLTVRGVDAFRDRLYRRLVIRFDPAKRDETREPDRHVGRDRISIETFARSLSGQRTLEVLVRYANVLRSRRSRDIALLRLAAPFVYRASTGGGKPHAQDVEDARELNTRDDRRTEIRDLLGMDDDDSHHEVCQQARAANLAWQLGLRVRSALLLRTAAGYDEVLAAIDQLKDAAADADALRDQRDSARRRICVLSAGEGSTPEEQAKLRGWYYLYEQRKD